jgi:hypothetical protein
MMFTGGKDKEKETAMLTTLIVFPMIILILGFEAALRLRR